MAMRGGPGAFRLDDYDVKLSEVDPRVYRLLGSLIRPYLPQARPGRPAHGRSPPSPGWWGPTSPRWPSTASSPSGDPAGLDLVALAFLATALLNWWSSYGQTYIVSFVGQSIIYDLRDRMFRHLQRLSFRFFDSMATGRIMSRLMSDVDAINQLVSSGLVSLFADSLVLVTIMGTMLWMNWRLALVSFITIPTLLVVLRIFRGWMRDAFMTMRRRAADLNAHLAEAIAGIRVTQAYGREARNQAGVRRDQRAVPPGQPGGRAGLGDA